MKPVKKDMVLKMIFTEAICYIFLLLNEEHMGNVETPDLKHLVRVQRKFFIVEEKQFFTRHFHLHRFYC